MQPWLRGGLITIITTLALAPAIATSPTASSSSASSPASGSSLTPASKSMQASGTVLATTAAPTTKVRAKRSLANATAARTQSLNVYASCNERPQEEKAACEGGIAVARKLSLRDNSYEALTTKVGEACRGRPYSRDEHYDICVADALRSLEQHFSCADASGWTELGSSVMWLCTQGEQIAAQFAAREMKTPAEAQEAYRSLEQASTDLQTFAEAKCGELNLNHLALRHCIDGAQRRLSKQFTGCRTYTMSVRAKDFELVKGAPGACFQISINDYAEGAVVLALPHRARYEVALDRVGSTIVLKRVTLKGQQKNLYYPRWHLANGRTTESRCSEIRFLEDRLECIAPNESTLVLPIDGQ